jgi:hypothetical protein
MRAANLQQGSSVPNKQKVAKVTWEQCLAIAKNKAADLNAKDETSAANIIAGTARSMGYIVEGHPEGRDDKFKVITAAELEAMKKQYKRATTKGK